MLSVEKTEMSLGLKMTFSVAQVEETRVSRTKHPKGCSLDGSFSPPAELRLTRSRSSAEPSLSPMAAMTSLAEAATGTRMVE